MRKGDFKIFGMIFTSIEVCERQFKEFTSLQVYKFFEFASA